MSKNCNVHAIKCQKNLNFHAIKCPKIENFPSQGKSIPRTPRSQEKMEKDFKSPSEPRKNCIPSGRKIPRTPLKESREAETETEVPSEKSEKSNVLEPNFIPGGSKIARTPLKAFAEIEQIHPVPEPKNVSPDLPNERNVIPDGNKIPRTPLHSQASSEEGSSGEKMAKSPKEKGGKIKNIIPTGNAIPRTPFIGGKLFLYKQDVI